MSMSAFAKMQFEPGSWLEAIYDFVVGTVVGTNHSIRFVAQWWYLHIILPILRIIGFQLNEDQLVYSKDGQKTLKVVAVGYGRTGTYSLALALEELGYPTLHTQHLYEHERIFGMWGERVFLPSIAAKTTLMGKPNLQLIAQTGYQATADLPMALYYEQVMEEFPDCKFILTTRESSDVWFRSWNTLTKSITKPTHVGSLLKLNNCQQLSDYLRWLFSVVNKDDSFLTVPLPLPEQKKEQAIASYEEHNRRVRERIPTDKLLEYNVNQGWKPLCSFLELDSDACPDTPFPKTNSARSVQVQAISSMIVPLIVVPFCIFYAFAHAFRRATGMTVVQWVNWKSIELKRALHRTIMNEHQAQEHSKGLIEPSWRQPHSMSVRKKI